MPTLLLYWCIGRYMLTAESVNTRELVIRTMLKRYVSVIRHHFYKFRVIKMHILLWFSSFWRRVVLEELAASIFRVEDGGDMFLRNVTDALLYFTTS